MHWIFEAVPKQINGQNPIASRTGKKIYISVSIYIDIGIYFYIVCV